MKISIVIGADTPESRDFAKILGRMYANSKFGGNGFLVHPSGLVEVECKDAEYENEYGVHRLVRISPFDKRKRRHTSFVLVEIDGKNRSNGEDWGKQVCSYILYPYQMAKNHITDDEVEDVYNVLSGNPLCLRSI